MWIRLLLATLGASILLSLFKNFLELKRGWGLDWDGTIERALIVLIFYLGSWTFIFLPAVISSRILFYLTWHRHLEILKVTEPGALYQRIRIKSELVVDLIGSPLLGILACLFIP
jgi:hypothetical protein